MKKFITIATLLLSSLATPAFADDALYQSLGQKPGLAALMDDFMVRLLADPRMQPFFKDTNQAQFKSQLVDQLCQVAGGPCQYKGPDMKTAHGEMDITKSHFNALVEVLQQSMNARNIPFNVQNKLLAQLAPMHRDVITVK
jgi:hemoglobin